MTPEAQAVIDLAKRTVSAGGKLTPELVMAAAYNNSPLKDSLPELAPYLPSPEPVVDEVPEEVAIDEELRPVFADLSRSSDVDVRELMAAIVLSPGGRGCLLGHGMPEAAVDAVAAALETEPAVAWRGSAKRRDAIAELSAFGRVLTEGEPPHKGQMRLDRYLRALQKHLLKMKRPSVIVIGQPGTGKTALVHEFARLLVENDAAIVPSLRDRDVFELAPTFLRAGAGIVGEYEERVAKLLRVLEANPRIILFVDEVHSLLSSATHERTPFSEANEAFKTAVGSGAVSLIGATTLAEYRHYIEPDGALARRFGIVRVDPPTVDETVEIMTGRASQYRTHYAPLRIPDPILVEAVRLTEDLMPGRFQPAKSLELLDEACALSTMATPPLEEVTEEALLQALEDALGHSVVKPGTLTEAGVLERLQAQIVGQDEAVAAVARAFVAGLSRDWLQHDGPRGTFMFCGPTGVGKTESARILSEILGGGSREAMLRIDCNTLPSSWDEGSLRSRLLGVGAGYVGYSRGEGGLLSRIRDMPECIVLFDEIEKASPAVGKLLLQIMDEGRVDDTDDNLLDFRRSFIIFTTNAGATYDPKKTIGFSSTSDVRANRAGDAVPTVSVESVKADLRSRGFGEEFLGRGIDFVVFEALERADVAVVLGRQLESLRDTAELRGYDLAWDQGLFDHLLAEWTPRFGARWVLGILRTRIVEQLALADAQGELNGVVRIRLVKRDADDVSSVEPMVAGLAARRRDGDTMTVLVR